MKLSPLSREHVKFAKELMERLEKARVLVNDISDTFAEEMPYQADLFYTKVFRALTDFVNTLEDQYGDSPARGFRPPRRISR